MPATLRGLHVAAQILALQPLEPLVLRWRDSKRGLGNFRRQNRKLALLRDAALFPLIGKLIAHGNAAHAFLDPILRISLVLVDLLHVLLR
jgi:hypothetical protein